MTDDDNRARIAELEADNRRLKLLLDQKGAPGALRHRLRGTLALMRTIIRLSAPSATDVESYAARIADRIDTLARVQITIESHGKVDLQYLVAEELLAYRIAEDELAVIEGPAIALKPRAGRFFAIALHELAANAMEHGMLGAGKGKLLVHWSIAAVGGTPLVLFVWKEQGEAGVSPAGPPGFGSTALTRMLNYELDASTDLEYQPDGFRCAIEFPLTDRVGALTEPAEIGIRQNLS